MHTYACIQASSSSRQCAPIEHKSEIERKGRNRFVIIDIMFCVLFFTIAFTEAWILVSWPNENTVTVHKESDVKIENDTPDSGCEVIFGRIKYSGLIAATD